MLRPMPALRRTKARSKKTRRSARRREQPAILETPHLRLVRAPRVPSTTDAMPRQISVATYNVHRWTGLSGRAAPDAARAGFVISELGADVIGLQEVLCPWEGDDPLVRLADALGFHLAYAVTRIHRRGQLGNAILSRWPIRGAEVLDISSSRIERRVAVAASIDDLTGGAGLNVLTTHMSLVDRTRRRQVDLLLEHPQLRAGPSVLLGDMNAWRRDRASRRLERAHDQHHNREWPASYPAVRPVLALDRVYTRGARTLEVEAHDSVAARRASDHLPIVARLRLPAEDF
jgi:endonuclease/exonuclease/phosphatase family metal-dependent hydrolase